MMKSDCCPKVSVLMPVYKTQEIYLREAIESILKQTFSDFEFLILDDAPDDNREKIVMSYRDNRIIYFKNKVNIGITQSRNKLIDLAKGEYLAVFDHDDISLPTRLEDEVAYLDSHPEVGVVSGWLEFFPKKKISRHPENNLDIKIDLVKCCAIAHTAAMIRKSVLDAFHIKYEEAYSPAEDYMLFLKLAEVTMFHNIQKVLVKYRSHERNTSHLQKAKMINADILCKCFAANKYPYLYFKGSLLGGNRFVDINIFPKIPFIKFKIVRDKIIVLLLAIIPVFLIRKK